ncbi:hypothetical protein KJA15_03450 [Patescibacteria group bacterium]|nr:hypothetical protein [Patescibacteria group bacterium]
MELQLYGLIIDFSGVVTLLLFSDPAMMNEKIHDKKGTSRAKIIRSYRIKRYFALILIAFGFIIQVISLLR